MLDTISGQEVSQKSPQTIKQNDKFFTRLLTKESSIANPSFRVYYGGVSSSVPFMWESHPGTPKHSLTTISIPPLTPPPSYFSQQYSKNNLKKHSRPKLLKSMFFRVNIVKKTSLQSSPSSLSSSSWSSSSWSSSSNASNFYGRSRFSSKSLSFDGNGDFEKDEQVSRTSVMCFGGARKGNSIAVMKKTFLAMVGRGTGY